MGCLSCLFSKAELTEPLPKAESSPTRPEPTRAKYDSGLQYSPREASKYGEQQLQNADTPQKSQGGLLAAPGPQRSRAGSRMGTQMSSVHDAPSDDDSHLRVSGNAVNHTNTHCSSADDLVKPRKERSEKKEEKEKEEKKEKEKDRSEKEKDRDKEERKGSGATISLPVAGEEWRQWKNNIACSDYAILNTLGRGAFADVVLGRHKQTNKHHALKVVYLNKPGLKEKHVAVLQREGTYLRKLQHKNIVRCLKVYQSPHQWVFVLEYLKGGMLLNDLAKLKRYSEKTAAAVFRQVLSAVAYLHENNIVHRDIKPENVVFKTSVSNSAAFGKDNIVKLVDFGMILDLSKEPHSRGMMGSPGFVAPEVILGQHHTSQMDCYSVGVLLFVMLVGAKPMTQDQARSMQYALMTPESLRGMHDARWRALTEPAKDLILKLLQPDPKNRFTAKQALNHRWIKGAREDSILDGSVMEGWADHLQMLHPGYMGSPSPFGANGFGASPHFNMRGNGGVSPHHGNFRGTGYRPSSGLQASGSSKQRGGHSGGHSGTVGPPVGGTPVSPLGLPIGSSGAFPPNPLSGPGPAEAGASRTHVGTPPADTSGLSNPFSWNAEGGHSAPLSQLQFADAAHKAVHDEVMKRAQEKFAQAQQYYMTAQIMRQADNSGLLHGAPQSGPLAAPAVGGTGAAAPHSPSKPVSGLLQTDGSDVTQCTTRHDHSLSAVAQSYMSTQNTSGTGTHGSSAGAGPNGMRNGKASADFDATLKDARNLMNELNKAPSLPQHRADSHPASGLPRVTKDADKAHSSSYKRSKGSAPGASGASGHVPRSPHRSGSGRRGGGGASGSHSRSTAASAHTSAQAVASTASSTRRPSRRSGQSQPIDGAASAAAAAATGQQRPRSILETPIQDPARDAYYGAGEAEDQQQALSPGARALRKASRRPSSQRLTSSQRAYSGPRPRSKGSKSGGANGSGVEPAAVTVE